MVKEQVPTANGATWSFTHHGCYARINQVGVSNINNQLMNCPLIPVPSGCKRGDGYGGIEKQLTTAENAADCRDFVVENQPSANGATWHAGSKACYAEFGQQGAYLLEIASGETRAGGSKPLLLTAVETRNGSVVELGPTQESAAKPLLRKRTLASVDKAGMDRVGRVDKVLTKKGSVGPAWVPPPPAPPPPPPPAPAPVAPHSLADGPINCPISAMPSGCQTGDGTGGTQKAVADSVPNLKACAQFVAVNMPSANGATWSVQNNRCWAEFGQTGTTGGAGADYVNCAVTPSLGASSGCHPGNGNGGMEHKVDARVHQMQQCSDEVAKRHPSANGATWEPESGECWAEYGQSGATPSAAFMNCAITPIAPPGCAEGNGNGAEEKVTETATMQECVEYVALHSPSANGASWNPEHPHECWAEMGQSEATGQGWVNCPIEPIAPSGCSEGEGTDGEKEELMKTPSMHACVDLVRQGQPAANGATWSPDTTMCVAEFGQSGSSGSGWVNCPVESSCGKGDGLGASEEYAGEADTVYQCTESVKKGFPSANGMTWGAENKHCYAEYGQNGTDGKDKWTNCPIAPTAAMPTPAPTPDVTCDAVEGDGGGIGSTEQYIGRTDSMAECAVAVVVHVADANAATWGATNKKCYAESRQSSVVNTTGWMNCYVSTPHLAVLPPTPPPCVDVSSRTDLVYKSKMDILRENEALAAEATKVKQRMVALRNEMGEFEATRVRMKVKFNTTDAFCELRKAQLNAHDQWVQAEMDGLKAECARAEGLDSAEFKGLLDKVLEAVKRKLE